MSDFLPSSHAYCKAQIRRHVDVREALVRNVLALEKRLDQIQARLEDALKTGGASTIVEAERIIAELKSRDRA